MGAFHVNSGGNDLETRTKMRGNCCLIKIRNFAENYQLFS